MRLFPKWHTPESVLRELVTGLRSGTVVLNESEWTAEELVAKLIDSTARINAILTRHIKGYTPLHVDPVKTVEVARALPSRFVEIVREREKICLKLEQLAADSRASDRLARAATSIAFAFGVGAGVFSVFRTATEGQMGLLQMSAAFVLGAGIPLGMLAARLFIKKTSALRADLFSTLAELLNRPWPFTHAIN